MSRTGNWAAAQHLDVGFVPVTRGAVSCHPLVMGSTAGDQHGVKAVVAAERAFTAADQALTRHVLGEASGMLDVAVAVELQQAQAAAFAEYRRLLGVAVGH